MKIAVMSCIHGNYEALNAVLSDIDDHNVDKIYCLGDLVGYGPHPNAVVEMIRALDIPTCQGCWDEDIVEGLNACECSYPSVLAEKRGKLAHEWTNQVIHPEVREYLAQLPLSLRDDNLCFVHGSPHNQHEYLMPEVDAFVAMERVLSTGADILFCGHTHVPYVRSLDAGQLQIRVKLTRARLQTTLSNSDPPKSPLKGGTLTEFSPLFKGGRGGSPGLQTDPSKSEQDMSFSAPLKRIVNAGSVGEPRHGRPNATYVIYDTNSDQILLREVEYDYQKTCAAIIEKGLPPIFAWRLARGLEFAERADDPTHVCER